MIFLMEGHILTPEGCALLAGAIIVLFAVFFYLILYGAARGRDRTLEDQAQMEYLRNLAQRKK